MLAVTLLGTSAARPTVERNVTSLVIAREGETLMIDCGEGTQRQMMRYGVSFALREIFFTHVHADHFLGITGLVRTLGLQGREEPMQLYGPPGAKRILKEAFFGSRRLVGATTRRFARLLPGMSERQEEREETTDPEVDHAF